MAPPGKPSERLQREADYAVERYRREGHSIVQNGVGPIQQNGRGGQLVRPGMGPYHNQEMVPYGYPNQLAVPQQKPPNNTTHNNSSKAQQNAEAIKRHVVKKDKGAKGRIREGKHAAAIDQIYENDLHNIEKVIVQPEDGKQNGEAQPQGRRYLNIYGEYIDGPPHSGLHHRPTVRPHRQDVLDPDTELKTAFDPIRDRHMWTMWRTAVNGRIVDEVRRLERIKNERGREAPELQEAEATGVYGKAIVAPPLKKFIRFDERSMEMANHLSSLGQGRLHTSQFVYYGLPRVYMPNSHLPPGTHVPPGTVPPEHLLIPGARHSSMPPSERPNGRDARALVARETYSTHL